MPIPGGWDNTNVAKWNFIRVIRELKQQCKDIIAYGGATIASSLIGAGLMVEYHLMVNPGALGGGPPFFKKKTPLKILKRQVSPCGVTVYMCESLRKLGTR